MVTLEHIMEAYKIVKVNTRHKDKLFIFELFYSCNINNIYNILNSENYHHNKYNIFIIKEPKYRLIMSECMPDKVINHLVSSYFLFPFFYCNAENMVFRQHLLHIRFGSHTHEPVGFQPILFNIICCQ